MLDRVHAAAFTPAVLALVLIATPSTAAAQPPRQVPTVYSAQFDPTPDGAIETAGRGKPLVEVTLRPSTAVVLKDSLDRDLATKAGVNPNFPFLEGTILYGAEGHAGLYCDLMRSRGLGSTAACLRDNDADGVFDEAVRFDFNSGRSDIVFLTDRAKVRGGKLKSEIALIQGLAYETATPDTMPTGRVSLFWESERNRKDPSSDPALVSFLLTDGKNFTGTEILSRDLLIMRYSGEATTAEFHGNAITVHGFGPKGEIRYSVKPSEEPTSIGFVFRGYIINIIGY